MIKPGDLLASRHSATTVLVIAVTGYTASDGKTIVQSTSCYTHRSGYARYVRCMITTRTGRHEYVLIKIDAHDEPVSWTLHAYRVMP